jgi:hypothetical protein
MTSIVERIEAIPGWDRSNFLFSVHEQARRGRALSPKQLAVVEKIEGQQGHRAPAAVPHVDIMLEPRKKFLESRNIDEITHALWHKDTVRIYDPNNIIAPNVKLQEHFVSELATSFFGIAENFAETYAAVGDIRNQEYARDATNAAREMEEARMHVKQEGPVVVLTVTPSAHEVAHRHKVRM